MNAAPLPDKAGVRRSFGGAASRYDEHAFLQREIGDRLFERLDYVKLAPARVLDIGSGTGYATRKLAARFPAAQLFALDIAPGMLAHARAREPSGLGPLLKRLAGKAARTQFLCADAEKLPLAGESVDAVFSNLALQWTDPLAVAKDVARVLTPGGLFMFTTFGPDTLKELRAAFRAVDDKPHVNDFPDMHDVGDMLVAAGFADPVMDQEVITLTYAELMPLLRELKGIGAHNVLPGRAGGLMGPRRWQRMVAAYETFRRDGRLPATYEVVYGHAWKPLAARQAAVDGQVAIGLDEFKRMLRQP